MNNGVTEAKTAANEIKNIKRTGHLETLSQCLGWLKNAVDARERATKEAKQPSERDDADDDDSDDNGTGDGDDNGGDERGITNKASSSGLGELREEPSIPETLSVQPDEKEMEGKLCQKFPKLLPSQRLELVRAYKGLAEKELLSAAKELENWNIEIGYQCSWTPMASEDTAFASGFNETFHGLDEEGHPITCIKMEDIDLGQLSSCFSNPRELVRPFSRLYSSLRFLKTALSEKLGYTIRKHILIADLTGLSMLSFIRFKNHAKALVEVPYLYFPDHVHKILILNPTYTFGAIYAIMKLWVDPVTLRYVFNLGAANDARSQWKAHKIPLESVPTHLGGKSKVTRELCLSCYVIL